MAFAQRYQNNSYNVTLVVNMNRLRAAEVELNEMIKTSQELVTLLNLLRLRQLCTMVFIKAHWTKSVRDKLRKNQDKVDEETEDSQLKTQNN